MATITVTEFAEALATDARTARKFLRSVTPRDEQPGKGARWSIEKREVRSLKSKFIKWEEGNKQAKLDRELAKRDAEVETTEADGPTPEELDALDDELTE